MAANTPQQRVDVPLDAPLYDATIQQAFIRFWKKYVTFSGRASRSEYWWWALIAFVVSLVLTIINRIVVGSPEVPVGTDPAEIFRQSLLLGVRASVLSGIWGLLTLIGGLALAVRRLHDTNRRGWWYFLVFIPLVGSIILIVFFVLPPNPAGARFDRRQEPGVAR